MRQIDLMVTAKKAEWENHMHAVQIQLDKKNKELEFVKRQLEHSSQEVEYEKKICTFCCIVSFAVHGITYLTLINHPFIL